MEVDGSHVGIKVKARRLMANLPEECQNLVQDHMPEHALAIDRRVMAAKLSSRSCKGEKACPMATQTGNVFMATPSMDWGADIAFIEFQPSLTSHLSSIAFGDAPGAFLKRLLTLSDFNLHQFYFTSIVKCSGEATPECIRHCSHELLLGELEILAMDSLKKIIFVGEESYTECAAQKIVAPEEGGRVTVCGKTVPYSIIMHPDKYCMMGTKIAEYQGILIKAIDCAGLG